MISEFEGRSTVEFSDHYKILNEIFITKKNHSFDSNFSYNSKNNKNFLSVKDLRFILKKKFNHLIKVD